MSKAGLSIESRRSGNARYPLRVMILIAALSTSSVWGGPDQPWNEPEPDASCRYDPQCAKLLAQYNKKMRETDLAAQRELEADPVGTALKRVLIACGIIGGVVAAYLGVIGAFGRTKPKHESRADMEPHRSEFRAADKPVSESSNDNYKPLEVRPPPASMSPPKVPPRKLTCECGAKLFVSDDFSGVVICFKCGKAHKVTRAA